MNPTNIHSSKPQQRKRNSRSSRYPDSSIMNQQQQQQRSGLLGWPSVGISVDDDENENVHENDENQHYDADDPCNNKKKKDEIEIIVIDDDDENDHDHMDDNNNNNENNNNMNLQIPIHLGKKQRRCRRVTFDSEYSNQEVEEEEHHHFYHPNRQTPIHRRNKENNNNQERNQTMFQNHSVSRHNNNNKHTTSYPHDDDNNHPNNSLLWCDKYQPTKLDELCIAPKKIQEVIDWMNSHFHMKNHLSNSSSSNTHTSVPPPPPPLLVLMGPPGIGKSTMIHCLSKILNFNVMEWNESYYNNYSNYNSTFSYDHSQHHNNSNDRYHQRMMMIDQVSPIQSFQQFLQNARNGYNALPLEAVSTTTIIQNNNENHHNNDKNKNTIILIDEIPNLHTQQSIQQFRDIFTSHIQQSIGGSYVSSISPTILIYSQVVDGMNNVHDLEKYIHVPCLQQSSSLQYVKIMKINCPTKTKFQKCLQDIVQKEKNMHQQKQKQQQLTQWIDSMYIQSGGDIRFAINTLQFELAGCSSTTNSTSTTSSSTFFTALSSMKTDHKKKRNRSKMNNTTSMLLDKTNQNITTSSSLVGTRDLRLSSFHALGKLLYAKRKQQGPTPTNTNHDTPIDEFDDPNFFDDGYNNYHLRSRKQQQLQKIRPPLEFDPEMVVEQCTDMDIGSVLHFVQYHSLDFFTNITDVSTALDYFSDAATLLNTGGGGGGQQKGGSNYRGYTSTNNNNNNNTSSFSIYPTGYVTSLTSRAVATANDEPTPNKFRQFHAPKIYQVYRQRIYNQMVTTKCIRSFFNRSSSTYQQEQQQQQQHVRNQQIDDDTTTTTTTTDKKAIIIVKNEIATNTIFRSNTNHSEFIVDILPFARYIVPSLTNEYYHNVIQSYFRPEQQKQVESNNHGTKSSINENGKNKVNGVDTIHHGGGGGVSTTVPAPTNNKEDENDNDDVEDIAKWQIQEEILLLDDIVDNDDDE